MFGKPVILFKILGFKVRLDFSWILLALLISWSLAKGYFPAYYLGHCPRHCGSGGNAVGVIPHLLSDCPLRS